MNPIWGHLTGVMTVVLMLTFIGIWIWAWHKSHQPAFSRMAALPMEDELSGDSADNSNAVNDTTQTEDRP